MPPEENQAGESLQESPQGDQGSQPITVPMDMLPGCKPGDTLKVSGVQDGNATLELVPGERPDESEQWANEAKAAVPMEE